MLDNSNTNSRSLKDRLGIFNGIVLVIAALFQFTMSFVPCPLGIRVAMTVGALCAATGAYRAVLSMESYQKTNRIMHYLLRVGGVGILMFFSGWLAALASLDIYTVFAGTSGSQVETSSGWRRSRMIAAQCAGPNIAGAPLVFSVCVDEARRAEFDTGAHFTLLGRVSNFGIIANSVQ